MAVEKCVREARHGRRGVPDTREIAFSTPIKRMTKTPARAAENEVVGTHNLIDGVDHLRGTFMRK